MNESNCSSPGSGEASNYRDLVSVSRPLFFSSTFRDMHAERDLLRNDAFLKLNDDILRPRRHELNVIDLRQGVEVAEIEDEAARELEVLKVCLEEISRSHPFLIGLLGDRYGWVPPAERMEAAARAADFPDDVAGKSVTELEILFAFARNPEQRERSRIYIREMDYTGMPDDVRADYDERFAAGGGTDEEQQAAADRWEKLKDLKKRLLADFPERVRTYPASWDANGQCVTGLDVLRGMVVEDLGNDLDRHTREHEQTAPKTWQEADVRLLEDFVIDRKRCFVDRPGVTDPAIEFASAPSTEDTNQPWGICLTGESGLGKSAIFAHLYRDLKQKHDQGELLLLAHAAGIHTGSGQVDRMLRRWIHELAEYLEVDDSLEVAGPESKDTSAREYGASQGLSAEDIKKMFASLLGQASTKTRVVLLIDALNQFERTTRGKYLTWISKPWPANARLLATAIPGEESETLGGTDQGYRCEQRAVPSIGETEAREITAKVFTERYHRSVNEQALEILLTKKTPDGSAAFGNPLWLDLALQELNLLEADDFARADRDFSHLPGAQRMEALLVSEAEALPPTVTEIYGELLGRAERTFGESFTREVVGYIALGRTGWRESDLEALVSQEPREVWTDLAFAGVRRLLGRHLVQRGEFGLWDFFHTRLRETAIQRYLGDPATQRFLHTRLVDHLERLGEEDPLWLSEMMVHLIGLGDNTRTARVLSNYRHGETGLLNAAHIIAERISTLTNEPGFADSLLEAEGLSLIETWNVADNLQFEVADAIESIAPLALRFDLLVTCRNTFERLAQIDPSNAQLQRDLSISLDKIGNILFEQGNLSDALEPYQQSLSIAGRLTSSNPNNVLWKHDLSISREKIGDILFAQGNLVDALEEYRQSLNLRDFVSAYDKSNEAWKGDLVSCHMKIGMVLSKQGKLDEALKAHQQSFDIADSLVETHPANTHWQNYLGTCLHKIGDIHKQQGNLGDALESYRLSFSISQHLAEKDPTNSVWQFRLGISHERIGIVDQAMGLLDEALLHFIQRRNIVVALTSNDPSNATWQRDLSVSQDKVGDVLRRQGNLSDALVCYRNSLAVGEGLVTVDPSNAQAHLDISGSHVKIGDVLLEEGDLADALESYQKSMASAEGHLESDQSNVEWRRHLSASRTRIGDVLRQQGDLGGALKCYLDSLKEYERLTKIDKNIIDWEHSLSINQEKIGDLLLAQGNYSDSLEYYLKSLEIRIGLAEGDITNMQVQRDLSVSQEKVGEAQLALGNLSEALHFIRKSLKIRKKQAAIDQSCALSQHGLVVSYYQLAHAAQLAGEIEEEQFHLHQCHTILVFMRNAEMKLDPPLVQLLSQLDEINP